MLNTDQINFKLPRRDKQE